MLMNIEQLWSHLLIQSCCWIVGSLLIALIARTIVFKFLAKLASKTSSDIDDQLISTIRRPVMFSILLFGVSQAIAVWHPSELVASIANGAIKTIVVLLWSSAALQSSTVILGLFSDSNKQWIQAVTSCRPFLNCVTNASRSSCQSTFPNSTNFEKFSGQGANYTRIARS